MQFFLRLTMFVFFPLICISGVDDIQLGVKRFSSIDSALRHCRAMVFRRSQDQGLSVEEAKGRQDEFCKLIKKHLKEVQPSTVKEDVLNAFSDWVSGRSYDECRSSQSDTVVALIKKFEESLAQSLAIKAQ